MSFLIYPGQTVARERPVNLKRGDEYLFEKEFHRSFGNVYPELYENVKITSNGAVMKGMPMLNLYFSRSIAFKPLTKVKRITQYLVKTVFNLVKAKDKFRLRKVILLTDHFSYMFFHWFGDILQKLEALEQSVVNLEDYTFIFPDYCNTDFARTTIKRYSINAHFISKKEIIEAKELMYIPLITPSGNFRPELMHRIRQRIRIENPNDNYFAKKIFITRKSAPFRTIKNEDELIPILNEFGYKTVSMENLPFQKQVEVASAAEKMVSLHGAGLTHMLWMKSGADIFEIRLDQDAKNNCYFSLASDLSHKYYYLLADAANPKKTTQATDFIVDPSRLRYVLLEMEY